MHHGLRGMDAPACFNILVFGRGGQIRSPHRLGGGQNPKIYTNSQFYHYCFCPRGGPNSIANFDGGPWPDLPPLDPPLCTLGARSSVSVLSDRPTCIVESHRDLHVGHVRISYCGLSNQNLENCILCT